MINSSDARISSLDSRSLDQLRLKAKTDPEATVRAAARQFEALFLNMMLKSMRSSLPSDGIMSSEETRMYTGMLDQQLAQTLSARGMGLADLMTKQLLRNQTVQALQSGQTQPAAGKEPPSSKGLESPAVSEIPSTGSPLAAEAAVAPLEPALTPAASTQAPPTEAPSRPKSIGASAREFFSRIGTHARHAAEATGLPEAVIVAQAALESGWGKHEIRRPDGSPSFNLFGIKAGRGWSGEVVETLTTEYVNGVAKKAVEKFKAYGSYAEAFQDWAKLLVNNPRYSGVVRAGDAAAAARELQKAGYATDPNYADKLLRIINTSAARNTLDVKA